MAATSRRSSLTRRQREIFEFLREKILNRGYGPTVREIGTHFDIRSPNGVMCHLKALERKGLISREQNMSRAIQLAGPAQNRLAVPLTGNGNSTEPINPPLTGEEQVLFNALFDGPEVTCVKVSGAGFTSLNIVDGDYLILRRMAVLPHGCRIAALDDRDALTICTTINGSGHYVAVQTGQAPVAVRQVLGVITGVIRKYPLSEVPDHRPAANPSAG